MLKTLALITYSSYRSRQTVEKVSRRLLHL